MNTLQDLFILFKYIGNIYTYLTNLFAYKLFHKNKIVPTTIFVAYYYLM